MPLEKFGGSPEYRAELEGERAVETSDLLKGRAKFIPKGERDSELVLTEEQKATAEREMGVDFHDRYLRAQKDLKKAYDEMERMRRDINVKRKVNGIDIDIGRENGRPEFYDFYLPQLAEMDREKLEAEKIYDIDIRFSGKDNEFAMEVYDKAVELAKAGNSPVEIYHAIEEFTKGH